MAIQLGSAYGKVEIDVSGVDKGVKKAIDSLTTLQTKTVQLVASGMNPLQNTIWKVGIAMRQIMGSADPVQAAFNIMKISANKFRTALQDVKQGLKALDARLKNSSEKLQKFADKMVHAGQKMTLFISIPIIGFLTMIIKKAMDAENAMAGLAKASVEKLNTSLAELGTKFLPIFIQFVDWLTKMVDKFNNADPAVQKFITWIVILAGMAGPLLWFVGTLIKVAGFFSSAGAGGQAAVWIGTILIPAIKTIGTTITTSLIPAIAEMGVALWTAFLPLLPIIALVAGLIFIIWAFATDFMGVTTTVKQLWFIIKHEFKKGWEEVKESTKEGWENTKASFAEGIENLKLKIQEGTIWIQIQWQAFVTWLKDWATKAKDWIVAAFNIDWSRIGANIISGIINGLNAMWDDLVALAQEIAQSVLDAFDGVLDMGSPSQAMAKRGMNSALGYMQGMRNGMNPFVLEQLAAVPLRAVEGAGGGQFNISIHQPNGLTMRDTSKIIRDSIDAVLNHLADQLENM